MTFRDALGQVVVEGDHDWAGWPHQRAHLPVKFLIEYMPRHRISGKVQGQWAYESRELPWEDALR